MRTQSERRETWFYKDLQSPTQRPIAQRYPRQLVMALSTHTISYQIGGKVRPSRLYWRIAQRKGSYLSPYQLRESHVRKTQARNRWNLERSPVYAPVADKRDDGRIVAISAVAISKSQ